MADNDVTILRLDGGQGTDRIVLGEELIVLEESGGIYIKGKLVGSDPEVTRIVVGLRDLLAARSGGDS